MTSAATHSKTLDELNSNSENKSADNSTETDKTAATMDTNCDEVVVLDEAVTSQLS